MHFASDNWAGAAPEIVDAVARAARAGPSPAYGGDALTAAAEKRFSEIFERDVSVFFVATGGAANGLALSALAPPYGLVFCHEESHVQIDECAGPEFFTGGAKLLPVAGAAGKIEPEGLAKALAAFPARPPHNPPPAVLSLTEASECGTVYTPAELAALCGLAHQRDMKVHVDGARFANALAALRCAPAELSWKAGVDALSFGATKNGCLGAEAVVFFVPALARDFAFRRKRAGHLLSKHWLIAAQFEAYFSDGLWLRLAGHANAMARRLADGIARAGAHLIYPVEANAVFASFPAGVADALLARGAVFHPWTDAAVGTAQRVYRLVCSFATAPEEVDAFVDAARSAAGQTSKDRV